MALLSQFDTPASLRDLPAGSPFYADWHSLIAGELAATTPGSGGGQFYDPTETNVSEVGQRTLVWMAFPRKVLTPSRDDRVAAFVAAEDRSVQDEYCEWRTFRNSAGKITKVIFTTEFPEYWERMFAVDPTAVVSFYRTLVDPAVTEADLMSGGSTYDRGNRWNLSDGIMHLQHPINTLRDALGLAERSVSSGGALDNYQMDPAPNTSVDPRVKFDIASLVRKGLSVTLLDPVGIYLTGWDDTGWIKPSGAPVDNYWRVTRGDPNRALRLEYELPISEGFVVGDIRIGGRPIEWGGQIAEHVTVSLAGTAGLPGR